MKKLETEKALIRNDQGLRSGQVVEPLIQSLSPPDIFDDVPVDAGTDAADREFEMLKARGCKGIIAISGRSGLCHRDVSFNELRIRAEGL